MNLLMMNMVTKMIGDDYRDIDDTYNGGIVAPGFGVKTNLQHQPKQMIFVLVSRDD